MAHAHKHFGAEKVVRGETPHASADMNVTPLIDVLLVLLIIFMATLPLTQRGQDINLPPDATKQQQKPPDNTQIVIEVGSDHKLTLNRQAIPLDQLEPRLRQLLEARSEKTLFVAGAGTVPYGEMMPVIDTAIGAGGHVAIVTESMRGGK